MNAQDLARRLCREVHKRRLARIGEPDRSWLRDDPLADLSPKDRQNWLDVAEAAIAIFRPDVDDADRLRELVLDHDRYTLTLKDPEHRREMQRAVVIEMRHVVDRLWKEAQDG